MWLVLVLTLALPQSLGYELESGCQDWTTSIAMDIVCCSRCKPGNRMVERCGKDPKTLCKPCQNGTYNTDSTKMFCDRCKQCTGLQKLKKACTASTDTVCECPAGFRCGGDQCSYCVDECGKGQEPVDLVHCRPCPEGTYNNKIHQYCVKWSSRCPSPDQKIVANGTAFSDIICGPAEVTKSTTPLPDAKPTDIPSDNKDYTSWTILVITIVSTFLIVASAVLLFVTFICKSEQMMKVAPEADETPAGWRQGPELEQCSFCFPQEEHGSSSEESQMSEDKPLELVV